MTLGKYLRVITKAKVNPLLGAAGTSAFPMSARVVQREGQQANPRSFLLFHANTGGQIGSVTAAAAMLAIMASLKYAPGINFFSNKRKYFIRMSSYYRRTSGCYAMVKIPVLSQ